MKKQVVISIGAINFITMMIQEIELDFEHVETRYSSA